MNFGISKYAESHIVTNNCTNLFFENVTKPSHSTSIFIDFLKVIKNCRFCPTFLHYLHVVGTVLKFPPKFVASIRCNVRIQQYTCI